MNINIDEIKDEFINSLKAAGVGLAGKESELVYGYITAANARFINYVKGYASGTLRSESVMVFLDSEKRVLYSQLISIGVVAGSAVESVINNTFATFIKLFNEAVIPIEAGTKLSIETDKVVTIIYPFAAQTPGTISDKKQNVYGVFTAGELQIKDTITLAKKLGCTAVRLGLNMDSWTGRNTGIEQVQAAGLKVYLNVNWKTVRTQEGIRMPQPFLSLNETADYEKTLTEILAKYKDAISLLVIENEETVNLFHSGTAEDYVYELSVAYKIAKKFDVRITNGGLVNPQLQILTYRNLIEENRIVAANDFYDNCMDSKTKKNAKYRNNKDVEAKVAETEYLLKNYKVLVDVVDFHWYEPLIKQVGMFNWFENDTQFATPGALGYITEYIKKITGKEVICNEVGVLNGQPGLVTSVLKDFQKCGIKELCWSSFTSDNGTVDPLNNGTELNNLGLAFANFLK